MAVSNASEAYSPTERWTMIPNFTCRVRNYVDRSPQCKKLSDFAKERLIKGVAKLLGWAYKQGFEQGKAHPVGCGCSECQ